jgi:hypothetical protein
MSAQRPVWTARLGKNVLTLLAGAASTITLAPSTKENNLRAHCRRISERQKNGSVSGILIGFVGDLNLSSDVAKQAVGVLYVVSGTKPHR